MEIQPPRKQASPCQKREARDFFYPEKAEKRIHVTGLPVKELIVRKTSN
jgi:hypothetical protein